MTATRLSTDQPAARAAECRQRAQALQERLDEICWNGRFYTPAPFACLIRPA